MFRDWGEWYVSMNEKEGPAAIYTTVSPSALYPGVIREEKCHFFNLVVDSSGLLIVLLSYYVKMVKTILIYSHNSYVTYHDIEITITVIYIYISVWHFSPVTLAFFRQNYRPRFYKDSLDSYSQALAEACRAKPRSLGLAITIHSLWYLVYLGGTVP